LPALPMLRDGHALRGDNGKIRYAPIFHFDGKEVRNAFSAAVIAAVEAHAPGALAGELLPS
jgi:hypothetical protein